MGKDGYLYLRIVFSRFFHYSHFLTDEMFYVYIILKPLNGSLFLMMHT